jgi:alpha-beta hydrolase superfamily lysophospholipase
MESKAEILQQRDGHRIHLHHYFSLEEPKASVILFHGMAEHHKRYIAFAEFLKNNGLDVYLYDHRGHGTETKFKELGFIHAEKGYEKIIEDALDVINHVNKKNRSNKLILLGHSMGSLILRNVIQRFDTANGVILCGTTHPSQLKTQPGLLLTNLIKLFYGPKHISPFINNLMFGSSAYTRLINRTSFDWLSRNNPSVGAYVNDPYCGFTCTISFYHDLLKLAQLASASSNMKKSRSNLPLLVISGEQDPVGGYGKEIKHLDALYKKWNFTNVTTKLYPDCRHELLQELNADEVMNDILSWILKQI